LGSVRRTKRRITQAQHGELTMTYTQPVLTDLGSLVTLTQAAGSAGAEDGTGKTVVVGLGDIGEVSVGLLP
jgi:hypothetical protein